MKKLLLFGAIALMGLSCGGPKVVPLFYPIGLNQRYEGRGAILIDQKYFVDHRPAAERQTLTRELPGDWLEYPEIQSMINYLTDAFITDFRNSGIFEVTSNEFDADYIVKLKLLKCIDLQIEFEVVILSKSAKKAVYAETISKKINLEDPMIDLSAEMIPTYTSAVIKMAVAEAIDKMANRISPQKPGLPPAPPRRPPE